MAANESELKRILSPIMVWGLGVGYVISGNYFGWNLGLEQGGSLGLAIATFIVIVMYVTFTYSYAELSCSIPKAGGAFVYASRALGENAGFLAGMAQNIEFIFAPPAIAFGLGSYLNLFFPTISVTAFSMGAYFIFTGLNVYGLEAAAKFELIVTTVAVMGLILFAVIALPHVEISHLSQNSLPHGVAGIMAALPFAIWFFLGIEGVANLAEEAHNPKRTMSIGFLLTLFTLITVCILTFSSAVGAKGWEAVVFLPDGKTSDSPLPMAISLINGSENWLYVVIVIAGLFGLAASFNGLMLAAGRTSAEFGREMLNSRFLGTVHTKFRTPANALVINMVIGILALLTGHTGDLITISVFGALTLYSISMISVIALRKKEPGLDRPFRTPWYPFFPILALIIAVTALVAMVVYNLTLSSLYAVIIGVCFGIFKLRKRTSA